MSDQFLSRRICGDFEIFALRVGETRWFRIGGGNQVSDVTGANRLQNAPRTESKTRQLSITKLPLTSPCPQSIKHPKSLLESIIAKMRRTSLLTSLMSSAAILPWPGLAREDCPTTGPAAVPTAVQPFEIVHCIPLHLSTSLSSNTVFTIAGTTVKVTNAPTVVNTDFLTTMTMTYSSAVVTNSPYNGPCVTVTANVPAGSQPTTIVIPPQSGQATGTKYICSPLESNKPWLPGSNSPNGGSFTTATAPYPGSTLTTLTIPPSGGDPTGTVLVLTPAPTPNAGSPSFNGPYTTITAPGTVLTTLTLPPSGTDGTGTQIVYVPPQTGGLVTATSTGSRPGQTGLITIPPGKPGDPTTIVTVVPPASGGVVTSTSTGTTPGQTGLITLPPGKPGDPTTVVTIVPPPTGGVVTSTSTGTSPGQTGLLTLPPGKPGDPTTVVTIVPPPTGGVVTSTSTGTQPGQTGLLTLPPGKPGDPTTVVTIVPPPPTGGVVTSTSTGTRPGQTGLLTLPPGKPGDPTTVVTIVPPPTGGIVTSTSTGTQPGQTGLLTLTPGKPGDPTTVVTIVPPPGGFVTSTSTGTQPGQTGLLTLTPGKPGDPTTVVTIVPPPTGGIVTSTSTGTRPGQTGLLTLTPGRPGDPTTVVTIVPPPGGFVTTTSTGTQPGQTGLLTLTPGRPGDPTTVVTIVPPPGGLTTVTSTGTRTGVTTLTPGRSGDPTTVVTFVPSPTGGFVTITSTGTGIGLITQTPSRPGDPTTVITIVPSPTGGFVTITSTGSSTGLITQTPGRPGDPTTVITLVPSPSGGVTTITSTGTGTGLITQTPGRPGDPTTVITIVPSPTGGFTTITSTGTGTGLITQTPGRPGDPTTVITIVPSPTGGFVTITSTGTGTGVVTQTPGRPGDPTTIVTIIPSPTGGILTLTSTSGSVTGVTTQTPGRPGDPTTVITFVPTPIPRVTLTQTGSTTGLTTLTPGRVGDPTTVITLVTGPPYVTVTSTGSSTGLFTQAPGRPGDPTTIVTIATGPPPVTVTSTGSTTGLTTIPGGPGGPPTVITFVPTPRVTTIISTASTTGLTTLPYGGDSVYTVVTFVTPSSPVTVTSTGSITGLTTLTPGPSGGPPTVVTFVTTPVPVTVTSTGSVTGLTTLTPGPSGGPPTVVTFVTTPVPVTVTSTGSTTGLTTLTPGPSGGPPTVVTFVTTPVPVTVTSTGSVTGLTTLTPGPSGGPPTVVTFVTTPVPVTVTSTGSITGLTTLTPGPSGGPPTVVTFVTTTAPIPPVTIISTGSTTGLTTVPPGPSGGPTTVITFVQRLGFITTLTSTATQTGVTTVIPTDPAGTTSVITFVQPPTGFITTVTSSATRTGATTIIPSDPAGTTSVITFVPITGGLTTITSTGTQTGATTIIPSDPAGTTSVITFVPPITGGLITLTSTGTRTGVTTIVPTDPAGTTSVITFVPITGGLTTLTSTGTQTGVTTIIPTDPAGTTSVITFVPPITGGLTTLTSTGTQTGATTIIPTDPAGTTSVITFVPPITGGLTTLTSTGTQTGVTTIIPTDPAGTTSIITFVPPITGGLTTLTSTGTQTGVTTIIPTDPAGTTSVITFVPPITGGLTTVVSTGTQTGLTTIIPTDPAGTTSVITFVTPSSTSSSSTSTTIAPGPTYSCDAGGYLIQSTTLYRLNLTTGVQTTVSTNVGPGGQINAIGYNPLDNYIYGITTVNNVNRIIRIASNGQAVLIGPDLPTGYYNVGEIDTLGRYYISVSGGAWAQIDMNPNSATFTQIIATGTSTIANGVSDWVYVPGGGDYLYSITGVDANGRFSLARWSRTTHDWSIVRTYTRINGNEVFGALYASSGNTFYGSENNSGNIYNFNVNSGQPTLVSDGPVSGVNDGARCVYTADPSILTTSTSSTMTSTTSSSTSSSTSATPTTAAPTTTDTSTTSSSTTSSSTSCVVSLTSTASAAAPAGATAQVVVPACATVMRFTVLGGGGGGGGAGASINGSIAVTPGETVLLLAGGAGTRVNAVGAAGQSQYGNGGSASNNGGGGGGASALYLGQNLLAVAGGGGGGSIVVSNNGQGAFELNYNYIGGTSNAGDKGSSYNITLPSGTVTSTSNGGAPGTQILAGAGGRWTGLGTSANGNPGSGSVGGNGIAGAGGSFNDGSGGGGGGYRGGGSGATGYYSVGSTVQRMPAGGGGGSSFVDASVSDSFQGLAASTAPDKVPPSSLKKQQDEQKVVGDYLIYRMTHLSAKCRFADETGERRKLGPLPAAAWVTSASRHFAVIGVTREPSDTYSQDASDLTSSLSFLSFFVFNLYFTLVSSPLLPTVSSSTMEARRSPFDDGPLPPIKSTACRRCHSRKVKCSGDQPCQNCRHAGKGAECTYPRRNRQVKNLLYNYSYIDGLLDEIRRLKSQVASQSASTSTCAPLDDVISTTTSTATPSQNTSYTGHREVLSTPTSANLGDNEDLSTVAAAAEDAVAAAGTAAPTTATLEVRPWFINANVFRTPILIGEVADAAFSTRFRQVISDPYAPQPRHMLRVNYAPDAELMALVKSSDVAWPTPSRSRFLVEVALKYVARRYHVVRRSAVMRDLEQSIHNPSWGDLMLRSKLWALFAIGELYSTRSIPSEKDFPGMPYFAKASRVLGVLDERPGTDSIEIMLLLSFYSLALNRRYSAFVMSGTAMRMAIVMGLHLNIPESQLRDPDLREHRKRLFWTTYIFDRIWASKLGHPTAIQDSDVGVDLPSEAENDGVAVVRTHATDFEDTAYHVASLRLAALITKTVRSIYGQRSQGEATTLSTRVQQALKDLRAWVEDLPAHLQLDNAGTGPKPISLHLSFNQVLESRTDAHLKRQSFTNACSFKCAILATRPILLHILRTKVASWPSATTTTETQQVPASAITLSEACIRCARHSIRLLTESWIDGSFATFDYFYTQYLFSALTILAASSLLQDSTSGAGTTPNDDKEAFEESVRFLSQLRDAGNFAAMEYCHHVDVMRAELDRFYAKRMGRVDAEQQQTQTQVSSTSSYGEVLPPSHGPGPEPESGPLMSSQFGPSGASGLPVRPGTGPTTAGMALTEPSLEELLAQPVLDLQFLEASFYDDLQALYWPDFSAENWDTWAST
ncbi:fungal specific transcription factor [Colletotrichum lupini]|uniref:Fungal specific transcription factor n=1 Tax=Colletotrichum lupini TaxID=145971 RepID=A0A9Q8WMS9_9PEZI|nr:fungal specific transcription factor [Colletotrichum lupini]UQC88385.1 fungal specific transcription factor [Colletotrichum lupini]